MRYRPRQVCLCDPNRLLSSLPRFSAHCHARSLLPTVVNHSTIYDENPDLHHGLLGRSCRAKKITSCGKAIAREITERKQVEEALERYTAMGRTAAVLAHEIHNLLEAVTNT